MIIVALEILMGRKQDIMLVWRTSPLPAIARVATFLATTALPLQQAILVDVLGDRAAESAETFRLELGVPDGAALGNGVVTGTVVDDDGPWQPVRVGQGALVVTTLRFAGGLGAQPSGFENAPLGAWMLRAVLW